MCLFTWTTIPQPLTNVTMYKVYHVRLSEDAENLYLSSPVKHAPIQSLYVKAEGEKAIINGSEYYSYFSRRKANIPAYTKDFCHIEGGFIHGFTTLKSAIQYLIADRQSLIRRPVAHIIIKGKAEGIGFLSPAHRQICAEAIHLDEIVYLHDVDQRLNWPEQNDDTQFTR